MRKKRRTRLGQGGGPLPRPPAPHSLSPSLLSSLTGRMECSRAARSGADRASNRREVETARSERERESERVRQKNEGRGGHGGLGPAGRSSLSPLSPLSALRSLTQQREHGVRLGVSLQLDVRHPGDGIGGDGDALGAVAGLKGERRREGEEGAGPRARGGAPFPGAPPVKRLSSFASPASPRSSLSLASLTLRAVAISAAALGLLAGGSGVAGACACVGGGGRAPHWEKKGERASAPPPLIPPSAPLSALSLSLRCARLGGGSRHVILGGGGGGGDGGARPDGQAGAHGFFWCGGGGRGQKSGERAGRGRRAKKENKNNLKLALPLPRGLPSARGSPRARARHSSPWPPWPPTSPSPGGRRRAPSTAPGQAGRAPPSSGCCRCRCDLPPARSCSPAPSSPTLSWVAVTLVTTRAMTATAPALLWTRTRRRRAWTVTPLPTTHRLPPPPCRPPPRPPPPPGVPCPGRPAGMGGPSGPSMGR